MNLKCLQLLILISTTLTIANCQHSNHHFERVGGRNINYLIRGEGPLMFVGHPSSGKIGYELSLQPLEGFFTMVYYEPRGTGRSEAPESIIEYRQEHLVEEVESLRKHLQVDKIWIFGHSDQSAIALEYALKFPDNISGLILSGTSLIGTQTESVERRRAVENQRAKESEWFAQVIADWDYLEQNKTHTDKNGRDISTAPIKWWCFDEESSRKVIPIVHEISKAGRRKPVDDQYYYETPDERQRYLTLQDSFSRIQTKTLIINGKFDTNNSPEYAARLRDVLPNAKLVIIEKAGHFPWIENADVTFEQIKKWLDEIEGQ